MIKKQAKIVNVVKKPQQAAAILKILFEHSLVQCCKVMNISLLLEGYAALFSCTALVQASDSMTASM